MTTRKAAPKVVETEQLDEAKAKTAEPAEGTESETEQSELAQSPGPESESATESDSETSAPVVAEVICSLLNVRPNPSLSKKPENTPVRTIAAGTQVEILEDLGEWYRIGDGEYVLASKVKVL